MNAAIQSTALELIEEVARGTDRVRSIVASGDMTELEAELGSRGECIARLTRTMSEAPDWEADEELNSRLADLREADRKLTEWMLSQKEEVALALASLRQQDGDPYADEPFLGSVLLNQTT